MRLIRVDGIFPLRLRDWPTQAATETIKALCLLLGSQPVKLDYKKATMSIEKFTEREGMVRNLCPSSACIHPSFP